MVADALTKPFNLIKFNWFFTLIGLCSSKGQHRGNTLG